MVFQQPYLLPHRTVQANVALAVRDEVPRPCSSPMTPTSFATSPIHVLLADGGTIATLETATNMLRRLGADGGEDRT